MQPLYVQPYSPWLPPFTVAPLPSLSFLWATKSGHGLTFFHKGTWKRPAHYFEAIGYNPDQSSVYIKWLKTSTLPQPKTATTLERNERDADSASFAGCHTSFGHTAMLTDLYSQGARTPMTRCATMSHKSKIMGKTIRRAGLCLCSPLLHQATRGHQLWKDRHSQQQTRSAQIFPSGVNVA